MTIIVPYSEGAGDSKELRRLRKQTEQFIQSKPMNIGLVRRDLTSDGAGGHVIQDNQIAVQTFRLIPQQGAQARTTVDGQEVSPDFVLLGRHDADIQPDDWFIHQDRKYVVVYVRIDRSYETWAEVSYRG